ANGHDLEHADFASRILIPTMNCLMANGVPALSIAFIADGYCKGGISGGADVASGDSGDQTALPDIFVSKNSFAFKRSQIGLYTTGESAQSGAGPGDAPTMSAGRLASHLDFHGFDSSQNALANASFSYFR